MQPAHNILTSLNDLMMNTARRSQVWILKKLFEGEPKLTDFTLEEQTLRDINDGGKIYYSHKQIFWCKYFI